MGRYRSLYQKPWRQTSNLNADQATYYRLCDCGKNCFCWEE